MTNLPKTSAAKLQLDDEWLTISFNQPEKNSIIADLKKFPKVPVTIYGSKCPKDYVNAINSIRPEIIFKRVKEIV